MIADFFGNLGDDIADFFGNICDTVEDILPSDSSTVVALSMVIAFTISIGSLAIWG